MKYSIDMLPDLPVLLTRWDSSFKFKDDFHAYSNEVKVLLDSQSTSIYYVIDLRAFELESLSDLMMSTELATRSGNSNFIHPMVRDIVWITTDKVWKSAAVGLKNEIYGSLNIMVFDTVDDALDYIKQQ